MVLIDCYVVTLDTVSEESFKRSYVWNIDGAYPIDYTLYKTRFIKTKLLFDVAAVEHSMQVHRRLLHLRSDSFAD